ncbi:MAG: hypothetical protein Ta2B_04450 [Termitinemataceae bacterium]|nr:MAG: hypothetical protein Ta2B_04450 [Termitinemataceae bacterium]
MKDFFGKIAALGIYAIIFAACTKLDVVGQKSIDSFEQIVRLVTVEEGDTGFDLDAPDNTARLFLSKNYIEGAYDILIDFDAKPFIDAGLDTGKMQTVIEDAAGEVVSAFFSESSMFLSGDKIIANTILTHKKENTSAASTPQDAYKQIVELNRESIGYHTALDHYGINLGNGNLFEWAKDVNTNDKDIVFVLNPQPFIDAGVDPNKIDGWVFAKVSVDDENGKPITLDKLLKPFNLK